MLVLGTILVLALAASAEGYCTFTPVFPVFDSETGVITSPPCMYKGQELTEGSHTIEADCMQCTCSGDGLDCCGYGINAGVIDAPDGCKVIADVDGCTPLLVKADDETLGCVSEQPIVST